MGNNLVYKFQKFHTQIMLMHPFAEHDHWRAVNIDCAHPYHWNFVFSYLYAGLKASSLYIYLISVLGMADFIVGFHCHTWLPCKKVFPCPQTRDSGPNIMQWIERPWFSNMFLNRGNCDIYIGKYQGPAYTQDDYVKIQHVYDHLQASEQVLEECNPVDNSIYIFQPPGI